MFELSFEKLLVIGLLAAFLLGPQHLPRYAAQLARLVRVVKHMAGEARGRLEDELGPDFDADLRRLDPRQYDPRRILRDALTSDDEERWDPEPDAQPATAQPAPTRTPPVVAAVDDEAT